MTEGQNPNRINDKDDYVELLKQHKDLGLTLARVKAY